jgi:hypothetical protein
MARVARVIISAIFLSLVTPEGINIIKSISRQIKDTESSGIKTRLMLILKITLIIALIIKTPMVIKAIFTTQ